MQSGKEILQPTGSQANFFAQQAAEEQERFKQLVTEKLTSNPRLKKLTYSQFYRKYSRLIELSTQLKPTALINNVNSNYNGFTTLILAADRNFEILVQQILQSHLLSGTDIDIQGPRGITALHCLVKNGNLELSKQFVRLGASCSLLTNYNHSALHFAAMSKNPELVRFVFENGGDTTLLTLGQYRMSPFHLSCQAGDAESVAFLWMKLCVRGAKHMIDETGVNELSPLELAAKAGSESTVRFLIECGAKLDKGFKPATTLLHYAASAGSIATYQLLESNEVTAESDYKGYDYSLLRAAVSSRKPEMVDYLFATKHVSESDLKGGALHDAVLARNITMVQTLLKYGTCCMLNVPYGSYPQKTPLQLALDYNYIDIAKLLFEHGAAIFGMEGEEIRLLIERRFKELEDSMQREKLAEILDDHSDVDPDRAKCSIL